MRRMSQRLCETCGQQGQVMGKTEYYMMRLSDPLVLCTSSVPATGEGVWECAGDARALESSKSSLRLGTPLYIADRRGARAVPASARVLQRLLAAHAQAGERHSVGRLNNLQTFHRPEDTIDIPQDLNPAISPFADIQASVLKRDADGLVEFAR